MENRINAGLDVRLSVIAPGGSVIYGEEAMKHLKEISEVVYLKMSYEEMERRIGNVVDRGVALKPGFTLRDLYNERVPLYENMRILLSTRRERRREIQWMNFVGSLRE